ncbi:MAG: HlyC/CorC family transporter [Thermoguttaceae bacterium]|nr:HlyC/CorC family transporter [Thermoguttaceae bacterium]
MSWIFLTLCLVLLLFSIACRALHEYVRHDLERLCQQKDTESYFAFIIAHYVEIRHGFEMIRSILLFTVPILAFREVGIQPLLPEEAAASAGSDSELTSCMQFLLTMLPYFFLYISCRYWIPRPLGDLYATKIVYRFFPFFRFIAFFALPMIWLGDFVEIIIQRLAGVTKTELDEEEDLQEDIRSIVAEGHRDGFIDTTARTMIDRIIHLDDAHTSTIMTPRTEMQCISNQDSWEEMLQFVNETQLSRIPVFGENRDDIRGILFSKDLLECMMPGHSFESEKWAEEGNLHPPIFVPETKKVNSLLQEFLQSHNHFAIVLDEYGGVSGVVTLEDILEEIVGEITDETDDAPSEEIHIADDGTVEVFGRVHIDELNTQLHTEFASEGGFETIGGFILTRLGRVPQAGEEIDADGTRLIVLEATPRKIEKIRIVLSSQEQETEKTQN